MSQRRETSFLAFLLLAIKLLPKSSTGEEGTSAWAVITVCFNPFKGLRAPVADSRCLKLENRSSQRKVALSLSAWHLGSVDASLSIPNSEHTHNLCSPDSVCHILFLQELWEWLKFSGTRAAVFQNAASMPSLFPP